MSAPNTLERRVFLAATAASFVTGAAGCADSDKPVTSTTDPTTTTSATNPTTDPTTSSSTTSTATSTSTSSNSTSSSTTGSTATTPATSGPDETSSPGTSAGDGGETSSAADTSSSETSEAAPPAHDACFEGGGTDAGTSNDAGPGVLCATNTDNGDHCHALVIPFSDIEGGLAEATYTLEDGGTGHTHTVTLMAYDLISLQAGVVQTVVSTEDAGHYHLC